MPAGDSEEPAPSARADHQGCNATGDMLGKLGSYFRCRTEQMVGPTLTLRSPKAQVNSEGKPSKQGGRPTTDRASVTKRPSRQTGTTWAKSLDLSDCFLARPRRLERPTPAFGGQYSIQLSYGRAETSLMPTNSVLRGTRLTFAERNAQWLNRQEPSGGNQPRRIAGIAGGVHGSHFRTCVNRYNSWL